MIAEATSQHREPSFALSLGIHRRQAWRPAGLRGVQSILSSIASRTRPFDGYRARLTAWYEQFVQRSQPLVGWQPSPTAELEAHDTQFSFGSPQSEERISRRDPPTISKDLPPVTRPVSGARDQTSVAHLHQLYRRATATRAVGVASIYLCADSDSRKIGASKRTTCR